MEHEAILHTLAQITTALGQLTQNQQQQQQSQNALAQALSNNANHQPQNHENAVSKALKGLKLPSFYGERDAEELDTWIFQMEGYFAAVPCTEEAQKVLLGGMMLRGQAATWWRDASQRPDTLPKDWTTFTTELKHVFMPVGRAKVARDKLAVARQRDNEPLTTYTTTMRRLFLAIPDINESEKLDRYVRGLLPHLRKEVVIQDPTTLEAAVNIAAKFEGLKKSNRQDVPVKPWHRHRETNDNGSGPMELGAMNKSYGNFNRNNSKRPTGTGFNASPCWNCGKADHAMTRCPDPIKHCNRCHRFGHDTEACPKPNQPGNGQRRRTPHRE